MSVNQAVLEAFQRFDLDKNGSISFEELVQVLKLLDEDAWDDANINALLARADSNGDGALQVVEFLNWIFAENANTFDLGKNFEGTVATSLVVSGCSRDINGTYVQKLGSSYNHRPIFYCAASKRHLFYHRGYGQWSIFWKPSQKATARLKTQRAPHMAEESWEVWQIGKKGFEEEPDMTCTLEKKTDEELLAEAPKGVKGGGYGHFKKQEELLNGRPVYFSAATDNIARKPLYFVYVQKNSWGLENVWMLCEAAENDTYAWRTSGKTFCFSPDRAHWPTSSDWKEALYVEALSLSFADRGVEEGWVDPAFPHSAESLGGTCQEIDGQEPVWRRAPALTVNEPTLFGENTEPADICQGRVGDCWLIAAIAAVAEFPHYLEDQVFARKELAEDGKYELRLYDLHADKFDERSTFVVDDYIPCFPGTWYGPARLAFANGTDKLFAPILEKAFAKYYGSYSKLDGGGSTYAIAMMTGETRGLNFAALHEYDDKSHRFEVIKQGGLAVYQDKDPQSKKTGVLPEGVTLEICEVHGQRISFVNPEGNESFPNSGWISSYVAGRRTIKITGWFRWQMRENVVSSMGQKIGQAKQVDDPFRMLVDYDARNYLMTAGIVGPEAWRRKFYQDGLVTPHAYSLLSVKEVGGLRMVCLRNPWGRGGGKEWLGGWKDGAQEWKANPQVADALEVDFKADGIFWLEWEDFQYLFKSFYVYPKEMPTKRGDFNLGGSKEPITQLATPSDVPQQPRAKAEDSTNAEAGRAEKPARPSPKAEDEPTWNEKHQCNQTWC